MKLFQKNYVPKTLSIREMWKLHKLNMNKDVVGAVRLMYPHWIEKKNMADYLQLFLVGTHVVGYTSFKKVMEKLSASN